MFRLAQVSDLHFRGFRGASATQFLSKRLIGVLNMLVSRRRAHRMDLLEKLCVDLRAQAPDHLVLTGDLSNIAIVGEWDAALVWIKSSGMSTTSVTVIPGNHDAYTSDVVKARTFEQMFAAYQTCDVERTSDYPFVRIRGDVALVGVNSAVPTGDFGAWGRVGDEQLARLEVALGSAELLGKTRVVLVHHPAVRHKRGEGHNLRDRDALAEVLERVGAELVLHGHDHEDQRAALVGPGGKAIPVIGAGSASYAGDDLRRARYNIFEIEGAAITWITRAHNRALDTFQEVRREVL
jgi:3',5'-cyclic AMP phosphodiesterase CpdA